MSDTPDERTEAWVADVVSKLPPFSAEDIAWFGRMAAMLDARRNTQEVEP